MLGMTLNTLIMRENPTVAVIRKDKKVLLS